MATKWAVLVKFNINKNLQKFCHKDAYITDYWNQKTAYLNTILYWMERYIHIMTWAQWFINHDFIFNNLDFNILKNISFSTLLLLQINAFNFLICQYTSNIILTVSLHTCWILLLIYLLMLFYTLAL